MPKVFEEARFTGRFYMADLSTNVIIPDITFIRAFAQALHARGEAWSGLFEGWPATYTPEERSRRPAHSRMTFLPAEFFVGESTIWHVAISWEDGRDEAPVELKNRRGIGGKSRVAYLKQADMVLAE